MEVQDEQIMMHRWIADRGWTVCKNCRVVKRFRGKNSPCTGKPFVSLLRESDVTKHLNRREVKTIASAIAEATAG